MKTTAILPIFNEAKTVAEVLAVLLKSTVLDEVVVVDDASTDDSLKIVKGFESSKLKIIHLQKNIGKTGAVKCAVGKTDADILFFCDGDLHGLQTKHILQLFNFLKNGEEKMVVGIRDRGLIHNLLVKKFGPLISGERMISRKIFQKIMQDAFLSKLMEGYAMEIVMNNYCVKNDIPIQKEIFEGVTQTLQPFKNKNGLLLLAEETLELSKTFIKLKINGIKK